MKCETVSLTKIEKFGKSPEGRVIPYIEVIHKKKCSKELHNLREDEEPEKENVEDDEQTNEDTQNADKDAGTDVEGEDVDKDEEMKQIREGFQRFLRK